MIPYLWNRLQHPRWDDNENNSNNNNNATGMIPMTILILLDLEMVVERMVFL